MSRVAKFLGAAVLGIALVATPAQVNAQGHPGLPTNTFDISLWGGYELPATDLADAADPGPTFGASIARRLHHDVNLRLNGGATLLDSKTYPAGNEGPSMNVYRVSLDVEVNLFDPKLTKFKALATGGVGWSFLSTDDLQDPLGGLDDTSGVTDDGPLAKIGLAFAYPVGSMVDVFLGADLYWIGIGGGDEDSDLRRLQLLNPSELGSWKGTHSLPITAGLRFNLD